MKIKYIFCFLIIFVIIISAAAEYTTFHQVKRVISADAADGMLFSSNYLKPQQNELNFTTIYINRIDAENLTKNYFDTTLTIANYAQGNPTRHYRRDINYTLTAAIVQLTQNGIIQPVISNAPAIKINNQPLANNYNNTLAGISISENEYLLSFPRSMLAGDKFYLSLTATPIGNTYTDLELITSLIEIVIQPEAKSNSWRLEHLDDTANNIKEYSGFNFRLSGSGRGIITLGWNNNLFEINEVFLTTTNANYCTSNWNNLTAITFIVDADEINNYNIQLYPRTAVTWSDVQLQLTFEEQT